MFHATLPLVLASALVACSSPARSTATPTEPTSPARMLAHRDPRPSSPDVGVLGCRRLTADTGWAYGHAGDVLCLEKDRILVLLDDGRWDGWPVRWAAIDGGWRAFATGASGVEHVGVHWDAGQDESGATWFRRDGSTPIVLEPLADADEPVATSRSLAIGNVDATCARARACLVVAPVVARQTFEASNLYARQGCAAFLAAARFAAESEPTTENEPCRMEADADTTP